MSNQVTSDFTYLLSLTPSFQLYRLRVRAKVPKQPVWVMRRLPMARAIMERWMIFMVLFGFRPK